tara:strand:+ start:285 stop:1022 length:738 start_codon:yes stop_codon:yes gene_type:complete
MINYRKKFRDNGFFILKNFVNKKFVIEILKEIKNAKKVDKYYDKKKKIRRIERIYNKGYNLIILNKKIEFLLKKIFNKKFYIFKDKYNAKPPKGEGFYAHYDGVFYFTNKKKQLKKGWYEYSKTFISVLIALDACNKRNGTLEIAKKHKGNFNKLLKNTNNDGTPNIKKEIEKKTSFRAINLKVGDIVVFSNTCPHRSEKNYSNSHRRTLYYTYSSGSKGSQYKKYFIDKKNSINKTSKSLEGRV